MNAVPDDLGVYAISVAAMLIGVHPQTLRTWDRLGLVSPGRTPGGARLYSANDIERGKTVAWLSSKGISVEAAAFVLDLMDENRKLRRRLNG